MGRTTKSKLMDPDEVVSFLSKLEDYTGNFTEEEFAAIRGARAAILKNRKLCRLKTCNKCLTPKSATSDFFDVDNRNSGGLAHKCKECRRRYMKRRRENHNISHMYPAADVAAINELRARVGYNPLPGGIKPRK